MEKEGAAVERTQRVLAEDFKQDWEGYVKLRKTVLDEFNRVVKEADDWYKSIEEAVFATGAEARKPHDDQLTAALKPLDEEWAFMQKRCETEFLERKARAEARYEAAYQPIAAEYKAGALPWETASEREKAIAVVKMEAIAEAEGRKEKGLEEPRQKFDREVARCKDEFAKQVFPVDEWERLTLKVAKNTQKGLKEIAEARRDEALQAPDMLEAEAKFENRIGDVLGQTLD